MRASFITDSRLLLGIDSQKKNLSFYWAIHGGFVEFLCALILCVKLEPPSVLVAHTSIARSQHTSKNMSDYDRDWEAFIAGDGPYVPNPEAVRLFHEKRREIENNEDPELEELSMVSFGYFPHDGDWDGAGRAIGP